MYWLNMLDAIWQSAVIFFIAYFSYANIADIDALSFGFSIAFSMTITSMMHVFIQSSRIDISLLITILLSLLIFFGFTLVFDATCIDCLNGQSPYQVSFTAFRQSLFWFTNVFTVITALLPRFIIKCLYNTTINPLFKTMKRSGICVSNQNMRF
jgi:phospholipid-translocating ATPase